MKGRTILIVAAIVLGAFALGTLAGLRLGRKPPSTGLPLAGGVPVAAGPNSSPCVDIRNAGRLVGKRGCVAGLVLRVYSARTGNTFLDFCQDYRTCPFGGVIFASDKNKFGDLESLQGQRVEIRGDVITYQSRAEIIIRDPQQLRGER